MAEALVADPAAAAAAAAGDERPLAPQSYRPFRPGATRTGRARPVPRGGPRHPAPAGVARPDRAAADPRRGGRLPRRLLAGRLRESGGPAAGVAALRRAHGAR